MLLLSIRCDVDWKEVMFDLTKKTEKKSCNGLVYRAEISHYIVNRGISFSVKLNKQKRLSCPGCELCWWLYEAVGEINLDWPVEGIESAEQGKLYTLDICNEEKDWESGIVDSWDLRLIEFKEQTND